MIGFYYLEVSPLPSNNAYSTKLIHVRNKKGKLVKVPRRFLQDKHRLYKDKLRYLMYLHDLGRESPEFEFAKVEITVLLAENNFYTAKGELQRKDASGHTKLIEDALSEHLNIDDKHNLEVISRKYPSKLKYDVIIVKIEEANEEEFYQEERYFLGR